MKREIVSILALVTLCVGMTGCKGKNTTSEIDKPKGEENVRTISDKYDVNRGIEIVLNDTNLGITEEEKLMYEEIPDEMTFSDLKGITYSHVGRINDELITDAWIIKLNSFEQYDEVLSRINQYIETLKNKYKENKVAQIMLNNKDNIKVEEKKGIVMLVIAPDASAIISGMMQSISLIENEDNYNMDSMSEQNEENNVESDVVEETVE